MRRLRGHHLFCGTLFQGCGYDEAFTRQMTETLAALAQGSPFFCMREVTSFVGLVHTGCPEINALWVRKTCSVGTRPPWQQ